MSDLSMNAAPCGRFRVVHETRYSYQSTVTLSQQYLHMTPRSFASQHTESHQIWVDPVEADCVEGLDYFGNSTRHIAITTPHKSLLVHAESTVVLTPRCDLERIKGTLPWETLRDSLQQGWQTAAPEVCRYLYASPHVTCSPELEDYARISYTAGRPQLDAALELTQRIFDDFEFDDTATEISTPLRGCFGGPPWCLSRFRSTHDWLFEKPRFASAICQWLHSDPPPRGTASHDWCRCFPCLGVGFLSKPRLGGF